MKRTAIVLAAGSGSRMKSKTKKQFLELGAYPLLYYSLKEFDKSPLIDEIILVSSREDLLFCQKEIVNKYSFSKVKKIIEGGRERYLSVYEGLKACQDCSYVLIHDGARPFISQSMIRDCLNEVKKTGACIVGVPVKDTIKRVSKEGWVEDTPKRETLWNVQTPQTFSYPLIKRAYDRGIEDKSFFFTDDAMLVERLGESRVKMILGSYKNIKITTTEDLQIAELYLSEEK